MGKEPTRRGESDRKSVWAGLEGKGECSQIETQKH